MITWRGAFAFTRWTIIGGSCSAALFFGLPHTGFIGPQASATAIEEDSPDWNGATMGNRVTDAHYVPPSIPADCYSVPTAAGLVLWVDSTGLCHE